ncbi:hypothetical protein FAES_3917 [Fibrella aestuarina BUZ 2]|uniref:Uncharacterized protein n=1 Tax=Fibrella aestuarina BUZ 2 TaxID=1166018 RepID=I0KCS0_9BACT|nr:hypothetical protein [Fibrella aestuarina]CCH01923.1 hypothetical protein FAES_3917 [Fibrella aestuarina BUZ 2]
MPLNDDQISALAADNMGAMAFLLELNHSRYNADRAIILAALTQMPTVKGPDLYVLWSTLCDRNVDTVVHLVRHCPFEVLAQACARYDQSSRELVAPYLPLSHRSRPNPTTLVRKPITQPNGSSTHRP